LWIYTSGVVYNLAEDMGCLKKIYEAGGKVLDGNCLVISPLGKMKWQTIMTDSGKFAYYLPSEHSVKILYAETENCIQTIVED